MVHRLMMVLCLLPAAFAASAQATAAVPAAGDPRLQGPDAGDTAFLSAYSQASADWGTGVEALIEDAFRKCFRTYIIAGRVFTLHLPFAENNERPDLAGGKIPVTGGGKADPLYLWDLIDGLVGSDDFKRYTAVLADGREKVVLFDLPNRHWSTTTDWYALQQMKAGSYIGQPHQPAILSPGRGLTVPDIYNYLYGMGRTGIDCAGFVWYVLKSVARSGGLDLDRALARYLGAPSAAAASQYVGSWFFDPRNKNLQRIVDQVRNLQPGDVFLFRGEDGTTAHTAVVQSVDLSAGSIRYLQSTDVAEQDDRGVHESYITFDPAHPEVSLKDPSVVWHQRRVSPFAGESGTEFFDDGTRFRAYPQYGGGSVVRLKMLAALLAKKVSTAVKK
jgi:cell wall-associated NlpC family hydrolase